MSLPKSQIEEQSLLHYSLQVASDVLFRHVEDEAVLLHVPSGTYYGLNTTGILLWQAVQNKQPLLSVVDAILNEYEVERSEVFNDVQILLQDLLNNGLIVKIDSQNL
jgi:Coenzyme PQQ synthesis protein D (PqqD)